MTGTSLTDPDPDAELPDPEVWLRDEVTVWVMGPHKFTNDTMTVVAMSGEVEMARVSMPARIVRAGMANPQVAEAVCGVVRRLVDPNLVTWPPPAPATPLGLPVPSDPAGTAG